MRNLNTHIKIALIITAMIGLANFANAQRKATRVIDNKGNIKYVLDSSSKVVDTGYNGLTKLNDTTLVLGGKLTQATAIATNGKGTLTFDVTGGTVNDSIMLKGLGSGNISNDSIVVTDPNTGALKRVSKSNFLTGLYANNGLTKLNDSVQLGGALTKATTITATPTNSLTLAGGGAGSINITGITQGSSTDSIVTLGPNGVLRKIAKDSLLNNLYANNGLTKVGDSVQLGGTLTKNDTISTNGNSLTIKVGASASDSVNITNLPLSTTGTNANLVVVDATTGKLQQMSGTSLLQSGDQNYNATVGQTTYVVTGMPATPSKVWVYRNGAKLLSGTDYNVTAGQVTLTPNSIAPNDWSVQANDVIEVQWVK